MRYSILRAAVLPTTLVVVWELLSRAGVLPAALVSRPSQVAIAFASSLGDGSLLVATVQTLLAAIAGWAIGSVLAMCAGIVIGTSPLARVAVAPAFDLFRSVPPVALIPVALLALGLGPKLEVTLVAFTVFWPVALLTATAVRSVDGRLIEVGRALRFTRMQRVQQFILPAIAPAVAVAFRLSAGIALVIAVTTEIIANPTGIGYAIAFASSTLRPDVMFAYLVWLAVIGFAFNAMLVTIEKRTFVWTQR